MADNATTQSGTPATLPAGFQIATDDVAGVHFQKLKIDVGGDGVSLPLSNANPMPVSIQNASLEIANDAGNPVPTVGPVTNAELRATALPVSIQNASLEIANDAGNPVPTVGPVTNAELRATALPVSIQNASLEIANDAGNPVPVNVAGVTVGEKLAASSLPVVLATENSTDLLVTGPAGQLALNALIIPATDVSKYRSVGVQIVSTVTSGSIVFEISSDGGTTYTTLMVQDASTANAALSFISVTATNRTFLAALPGALFRVRISAVLAGGVVQASAVFSQMPLVTSSQSVVVANTSFGAVGTIAQGGAAGNVLAVASESRITARTATGDAQLSRPIVDKLGRVIVADGQIRELTDTNTLTVTTVTETTLIAAIAAVTNDIRELVFANTSATAVRLDLRDSTAGTVRLSVILEPGKTLFLEFTRLKQTAVNTSWTVQLSAAVTDVRITAISERVS
jgi:hypothetical protein